MSTRSSGFILSDIFTRYFEITATDPKSLIGSIKSLQSVILRVGKIFPGCECAKNLTDLRQILKRALWKEAIDLSDNPFAKYFLDWHRIQYLFTLMETGDTPNQNAVGYYPQLECLKVCRNSREVHSFVVCGSEIERYFESSMIYGDVIRNFYETAKELKNDSFVEIIEEEIKARSTPKDMHRKLMRVYRRVFECYGDLSVVYAYLKLREIQIREIMFYCESLLNAIPADSISI